MVKKRRRFSREYKQEVAEMVLRGGHEIHVLSKELDLRPDMIQRWVKKVHQEIPLRGESKETRMTTTKNEETGNTKQRQADEGRATDRELGSRV